MLEWWAGGPTRLVARGKLFGERKKKVGMGLSVECKANGAQNNLGFGQYCKNEPFI